MLKNRTKMSAIANLQQCIRDLCQWNKAKKKQKNGKGRNQTLIIYRRDCIGKILNHEINY